VGADAGTRWLNLSNSAAAIYKRGSDVGELIGLGQLRSNAIGFLERVQSGETIEVARRGKLVGRICVGGRRQPRRGMTGSVVGDAPVPVHRRP